MHAPDWVAAHQAEWERFTRTETGQTLLGRMRALQWLALLGAAEANDAARMQRVAGWGEALRWLESLSRVSLPSDKGDDNAGRPDGEPGIREQFTP